MVCKSFLDVNTDDLRVQTKPGKQMTIPGQNQSIDDMIARFTAGVPLPQKEPMFFGDVMPLDVNGQSFDPLEVLAHGRSVAKSIDAAVSDIEQQQQSHSEQQPVHQPEQQPTEQANADSSK